MILRCHLCGSVDEIEEADPADVEATNRLVTEGQRLLAAHRQSDSHRAMMRLRDELEAEAYG